MGKWNWEYILQKFMLLLSLSFRRWRSLTSTPSGTPERGSTPNNQRLVKCVCVCVHVRKMSPREVHRSVLWPPTLKCDCHPNVYVCVHFFLPADVGVGDRTLMSLLTDGLSDRKWYNRWLLARKSLCKSLDRTPTAQAYACDDTARPCRLFRMKKKGVLCCSLLPGTAAWAVYLDLFKTT